jgi:Ca-activated chloride channel family protein
MWYRTFGTTELIFIALFVLAYGLYLMRMVKISKVIKTGFQAITFKALLRFVYFLLLIVALLGPLFGSATKEVQAVGKDIYIAVDLSQSMNARDVPPTRLEKVKYELKNIIEAFSSDRIGLIIFSSEAFVQCPLTYDQSALTLFIETLHTGLVPNTSTDLGPPLRMALNKITAEDAQAAQQKSKIIILISDGEDFGSETSSIAEDIKENGIRLFTLGVGTEEGSNIIVRGIPKTDRQGNQVVTKLDPAALKNLATLTGGKYFEISDDTNDTERLISTISNIEGELKDSRQVETSANKYVYFLALAVLLFIVDNLVKLKTVKL